jgi:hypothetical protein
MPLIDIVTACPACGQQTLFVNDTGHLTCAWHPCPQPSVAAAIAALQADRDELARVTAVLVAAVRDPAIARRLRTVPRETSQNPGTSENDRSSEK